MSSFKRVLEEARARLGRMGVLPSEEVRKVLEPYRRRNFSVFTTLFVICIVTVILGLTGIALNFREPSQITAFSGAMGITVGGLIEAMRRIWRQWSQADLILILIRDAPEESVKQLISALITKLD